MQAFKTALRIYFKHPVYIAIYIVALSLMAVFIGKSMTTDTAGVFRVERPQIAIVDRDGSALSKGLTSFLTDHGRRVKVTDDRVALQDTMARGDATWMMVIPAGFGQDFLAAAGSGGTAPAPAPAPAVKTIIGQNTVAGTYMDQLANAWLKTARTYAKSGVAGDQSELTRLTSADMAHSARVTTVQSKNTQPPSQQYLIFMGFSGYSIMLSIIVSAGLIMVAFNRAEVRKRDLASPVSSLARNLQIAAASLVVALIAWAWVSVLGLVVFGGVLSGVSTGVIVLLLLSLLVYCSVPLAISFFLGQITGNELVLNAVGNILGLSLSFLGGLWIPISLMTPTMRSVSRFVPTTYFENALTRLAGLKVISAQSLGPVLWNWAVIALFAAAIFVVALAVGRLRMQSATAGGNASAARSVA
ncbi:MAG: ABC transporter permease [Actinomycetia bacterium]|nr:ABC transporter permease [Actinomycetes bacterium]